MARCRSYTQHGRFVRLALLIRLVGVPAMSTTQRGSRTLAAAALPSRRWLRSANLTECFLEDRREWENA